VERRAIKRLLLARQHVQSLAKRSSNQCIFVGKGLNCGRCRYAIASAVLQHLSATTDCCMLFATHYAALTAEVAGNARVALGYMAAIVGDDAEAGGDGARTITFLYQKRSGVCPSRCAPMSHIWHSPVLSTGPVESAACTAPFGWTATAAECAAICGVHCSAKG